MTAGTDKRVQSPAHSQGTHVSPPRIGLTAPNQPDEFSDSGWSDSESTLTTLSTLSTETFVSFDSSTFYTLPSLLSPTISAATTEEPPSERYFSGSVSGYYPTKYSFPSGKNRDERGRSHVPGNYRDLEYCEPWPTVSYDFSKKPKPKRSNSGASGSNRSQKLGHNQMSWSYGPDISYLRGQKFPVSPQPSPHGSFGQSRDALMKPNYAAADDRYKRYKYRAYDESPRYNDWDNRSCTGSDWSIEETLSDASYWSDEYYSD